MKILKFLDINLNNTNKSLMYQYLNEIVKTIECGLLKFINPDKNVKIKFMSLL